MLLEFRVDNFRSFLDEQVFNLVAARGGHSLETNCLETGLTGLPHVVRTAAVYGANASGKSNLVQALSFFQKTVRDSAQGMREGASFELSPFRFAPKADERGSTFEATFLENGVRHQYGFTLNRERVLEEWLLVYRAAKPQQWFQRTYDPQTEEDKYEFSSYLTGERRLWQKSTRSNALFLSTAVQLNSPMLRPIYQWIADHWTIIETGSIPIFESIQLLEKEDGKQRLLRFLCEADLGIADARVTRRPLREEDLLRLRDILQQIGDPPEALTVELEHRATTAEGDTVMQSLPLSEESLGTRRMFSMAAPILRALDEGGLLVIDELDRSLHPLLTRFLVQLFHQPGSKAQLVFTTHSTSLIDLKDLFRRDQVFFVEKKKTLATELFPLSDFKLRQEDAVEKRYLQGRLGAVPVL